MVQCYYVDADIEPVLQEHEKINTREWLTVGEGREMGIKGNK